MSLTPKAKKKRHDEEDFLAENISQIKDWTVKCLLNGIISTERIVSFQFIDLYQRHDILDFEDFLF